MKYFDQNEPLKYNHILTEGFFDDDVDDADIDDGGADSYEAIDSAQASLKNLAIQDLDIKKTMFAVANIDALTAYKVEKDPNTNCQILRCNKPLSYQCIKQAREKLIRAGWRMSGYLNSICDKFVLSGQPGTQFQDWYENTVGQINDWNIFNAIQKQVNEYYEITEKFPNGVVTALTQPLNNHDLYRVGISPDGGMYYYECYCSNWTKRPYGGGTIGFTGELYYILNDIYDKDAAKAANKARAEKKRKVAALGKLFKKYNMYNEFHRTNVQLILDEDRMPMARAYVPGRYAYQWRRWLGGQRMSNAVDLSRFDQSVVPSEMYVIKGGELYVAMYDGTRDSKWPGKQCVDDWIDKYEADSPDSKEIHYPWDWHGDGRGNFIVEVGLTEYGIETLGLK